MIKREGAKLTVVGPVQPVPPHCPYTVCAAPDGAVVVGFVEVVVGFVEMVVGFVEAVVVPGLTVVFGPDGPPPKLNMEMDVRTFPLLSTSRTS